MKGSSARHLERPNNAIEAYTENPVGRKGGRTSLKRFSLVTAKQVATVLPFRKPTQRDRIGEIPEGLPGSQSVARRKRDDRNLGGPMISRHERVGCTNEKEGA